MTCKVVRDEHGTSYEIPKAKDVQTPGGKRYPGSASVLVWWDRDIKNKADETLYIRQDNSAEKADVITLTLGQVYDLMHACGLAIVRT